MTILCPNMVRPMSPPPHFGVGLLVCDKPRRLAGTQTAALSGLLLSSELRLEELREHHSVSSLDLRPPACASVCHCARIMGALGACFRAGGAPAGKRKTQLRPLRVVSLRQRGIKLIDFHEDG